MQCLRRPLGEHSKSPAAQPTAATDKTDATSATHQFSVNVRPMNGAERGILELDANDDSLEGSCG
jgi:hypothetical protein